jgi:tetratricopeptide (TPR) repeat protein
MNRHFILLLAMFFTLTPVVQAQDFVPPRPVAVPSLMDFWIYWRQAFDPDKDDLEEQTDIIASNKMNSNAASDVATGIAQLELAAMEYTLEEKRWSKAVGIAQKAGKDIPRIDHKKSLALVNEAKNNLKNSANKVKPNAKTLFYAGVALALANEPLSVNMIDKLSTKFPKSKLNSVGSYVLYEYYTAVGDQASAQKEWKRAKEAVGKDLIQYMEYRTAWQGMIKALQAGDKKAQVSSLNSFVRMYVKIKAVDTERADFIKSRLVGETIGILSDLSDLEVAKVLLKQIDQQSYYNNLLRRVAAAQLTNGDLKGAKKLYTEILAGDAMVPLAPEYAGTLVEIAFALKNYSDGFNGLKAMVKNYVDADSVWLSKNSGAAETKATEQIELLLYKYATNLDKIGRDSKDPRMSKIAAQLYEEYVTNFSDSKRISEVAMYNVQLRILLKEYSQANSLARTALEENLAGKNRQGFGELLVAAAQSQYDADKGKVNLPAAGKAKTPVPFTAGASQFITALDFYADKFPKAKNLDAIEYAAALVHFDYGHYDDAMLRFEEFISKHANSSFASEAAIRALGYYMLVKDEESLANVRGIINKNPTLRAMPQIAQLLKVTKKPATSTTIQPPGMVNSKNKPAKKTDADDEEDGATIPTSSE